MCSVSPVCLRLPFAFQEPLGLRHHARYLRHGNAANLSCGLKSFRARLRLDLLITQWLPTNSFQWPLRLREE